MKEEVVAIIVFFILLLIKIVKDYLILNNKNVLIKDNEKTIDNFINKHYKIILVIFLGLIFITRIYKFGEIPDEIGVDEAGAAYDACCLAKYGTDRYLNKLPVYLINFGGGQSALYAYSTILFIKLFGANLISYRLPELIFYLIGIIVCYVLANKYKDKKTAILYAFVIISCPWNIISSRMGLDCNLLAPMFMIDILLLLQAKKDWHYILAGFFIGLTLYTYSLAWINIPIFLVFNIIYMLYIKKINIKQIILLGIPIFILALPLIYFILLNKGIVSRTDFGIFTIPKLFEFRVNEIGLSNIFTNGISSLKRIFLTENMFYFIEIPFFIYGLVKIVIDTFKTIKEKKFNFDSFIGMTFIVLLISCLINNVRSNNQAVIIYLPMLYITTIGMIDVCKKDYICTIINIVFLLILLTNYMNFYYKKYYDIDSGVYTDRDLYYITKQIETNENDQDKIVYIIPYQKQQAYIYTALALQIAPYELQTENNDYQAVRTYFNKFSHYRFVNKKIISKLINNEENQKFMIILDKNYMDNYKSEFLNKNYKIDLVKKDERYYIIKNY